MFICPYSFVEELVFICVQLNYFWNSYRSFSIRFFPAVYSDSVLCTSILCVQLQRERRRKRREENRQSTCMWWLCTRQTKTKLVMKIRIAYYYYTIRTCIGEGKMNAKAKWNPNLKYCFLHCFSDEKNTKQQQQQINWKKSASSNQTTTTKWKRTLDFAALRFAIPRNLLS